MLKDGQHKRLRIEGFFTLFNAIILMKNTGGKKQGLNLGDIDLRSLAV